MLVDLVDPLRPALPDDEFPASFVTDLAKLVPCSYASFVIIDARNQDQQVQDFTVEECDPFRLFAPRCYRGTPRAFLVGILGRRWLQLCRRHR
jgi:hypothetical protein